jgi:methylmalonyl-CoA mutase N-terminal domain/subunit
MTSTQEFTAQSMAEQNELERLRAEVAAWRARFAKGEKRDLAFSNSTREIEPLYTELDRLEAGLDTELPGAFAYTRGIHPTGYRGRLWTMRQFAGFGSARDTNERYKFLLEHGQTGLSVAFDFPTLMGYDSDDPLCEGEVGRTGVAIDSIDDMRRVFDGIPLDQVSTSMTINGPAIILWAFYIACAEKQGVSPEKLRGTTQNDILKEYMAQHAWVYPIEPAVRLIVDCFEWGARNAPLWNTISISGYHIREAGSTAVQELAFTLADGFCYVEHGIARGLPVDEFAPRLSFFWDVHNDFFEEIAKMRAARRIWARHLRDRYGARDPRSWTLRFHSQTAGVTLTAQQPMNNIVRVAYQALAAVLGGTQSLHTNSMDETLALPTEESVQVALRTQQVLAYETGVPNVIDPLGGSYYIETLTDQMEAEAEKMFEQHRRVIVGVNEFVTEEPALTIPLLRIGAEVEQEQRTRMAAMRARRDNDLCARRLATLKAVAATKENVFPAILDCARCYCTLYEIRAAMEEVFGAYREPVFF